MTAIDNDYIEIDAKHWLDKPEFSANYENFIAETPKVVKRITDDIGASVVVPCQVSFVDRSGQEVIISI